MNATRVNTTRADGADDPTDGDPLRVGPYPVPEVRSHQFLGREPSRRAPPLRQHLPQRVDVFCAGKAGRPQTHSFMSLDLRGT